MKRTNPLPITAPDLSPAACLPGRGWCLGGFFFGLVLLAGIAAGPFLVQTLSAAEVTISEADYEGRPQYKVVTPSATWFLDRRAGGFSRLIDRDGRDWIGFRKEPLSRFPDSVAAGYRGIPNLVFGKDNPDAGAGHPGFDQCESTLVNGHVIRTVSKSGRWAWTWTFEADTARMRMERAPSGSKWWFLYEGAVGGRWSPQTHYWGTDQGGPRREQPDIAQQQFDLWRWAYFGDDTCSRVLFIGQGQPDALPDTLWYLGCENGGAISSSDGMVVFGLGRGPGTTAHFEGPGQEFTLGLLEMTVQDERGHAEARRRIESALGEARNTRLESEAPPGDKNTVTR
jgi:hypothetical protein